MNDEKNIVVAPVGNSIDALFVGLKDFPTERIILVADHKEVVKAEDARNQLKKFRIPVEIKKIKGNIWEEMFRAVSEIKKQEEGKNVIVNVSTGDKDTRCAATSAAFVNGLRAFATDGDETMMLPILKFSYYKLLTDRKMQILKLLYTEKDCCASLDELSKKTKMSLPLISYHIHGTLKSDGLKELGLIDVAESKGRVSVQLSTLGRLLVKGYVM